MRTLFCFYDMSVSPCSYDFFVFLYSAEVSRIRRKLEKLKLILIHGPKGLFRQDNIRTHDQNLNFFHNVVIPGISLIPSCDSFLWLDRNEASIDVSKELKFPRDYDPKKPTNEYLGHELVASKIRQDEIANFFAPKYAVNIARQLIAEKLNGQPFITLTAREIERDDVNKTRRINQKTWLSAINTLEERGIKTLIIRETEKAFKKPLFDGVEEAPVGSVHLHLRMALGHLSACNFSKNNGPGVLNLLSSNGGVFFNEFDENVFALSKNWYETHYGMSKGSQFPMTGENNLFEWKKEDEELIIEHTLRSQSNKGKHIPDHTYFDEQNFISSVQVGLRHLVRCLNHGVLNEDLDFFFKLEQMNKSVNFTDSLLDLIAEQRKGSLNTEAFDVFEELIRKHRPA